MSWPISVVGLKVVRGGHAVLTDYSCAVEAGECVALMGPSGSGKTTLLSAVTGVSPVTAGSITVGTTVISKISAAARAEFRRRHVGLIFQDPELLPELTVAENVALLQIFDGVRRSTALERAHVSLSELGVAHLAARAVHDLSGGEAQRVALARAFARSDLMEVLVADEPTASLDPDNAMSVIEALRSRVDSSGVTALIATHDERVAAACDRVVMVRPELAPVA